MGMAASQARFLGLTARKVNVEFQGQQINQARTSLANESANLYNEMLSLKVPVPPSVSDYYNTSYKFSELDSEYEITSGLGLDTCQAKITKTEYVNTVQRANYGATSTFSFDTNGKVSMNGCELTKLNGENGSNISVSKIESLLNDNIQLAEGAGFRVKKGGDVQEVRNLSEYQAKLAEGYALDETSKYNELYGYTKSTNPNTVFFMQGAFIPENDGTAGMKFNDVPQEFFEKETKSFSYETITNCNWVQDRSGRYTSFSGNLNGTTINQDLEFEQIEDSVAYEQAMLNYEYEEALYEKEIENINSKTKKIQEQDRGLELQLRQCDTEQEAISKELEAIKKVIQDNVDKVFKTFA